MIQAGQKMSTGINAMPFTDKSGNYGNCHRAGSRLASMPLGTTGTMMFMSMPSALTDGNACTWANDGGGVAMTDGNACTYAVNSVISQNHKLDFKVQ